MLKKPRGYDKALEACDLATNRLRCINRELKKQGHEDNLSAPVRTTVREALRKHLIRCEGVAVADLP